MKKILFLLLLLINFYSSEAQVSIKVGYGPDYLSQLGDHVHERFAQIGYKPLAKTTFGIGYRQFRNIRADRPFSNPLYQPTNEYISARESGIINSKEIYAFVENDFNYFHLSLSLGFTQYNTSTELNLSWVPNDIHLAEPRYTATHDKHYSSTSHVRAGMELSYDIRLIEQLYLVPYGRYLYDFRSIAGIKFNLKSMDSIDPEFTYVPEGLEEFDASTTTFYSSRAIIVFGLALKYEL